MNKILSCLQLELAFKYGEYQRYKWSSTEQPETLCDVVREASAECPV